MDCGLFHTFDEEDERVAYVASLASVTRPGGTLYVLCFSDQGSNIGPHPVSADDLRAAFDTSGAWRVVSIEPDRIETLIHDERGGPAWLATIART